MSQPTEDFSEIRRVLAWKGRETPPPGYFNHFSTKIIARIEAERLAAPAPWWHPLAHWVNWQRGLMGANLLIAAGAGIVGIAAYHTLRPDAVAWQPLPTPTQEASSTDGIFGGNRPVLDNITAPGSPLKLAGFSNFGSSGGNPNDHTAPAGLFNPPGLGQLQTNFSLPTR